MFINKKSKKIIFITYFLAIIIIICFILKNYIQDYKNQKSNEDLIQIVTKFERVADGAKNTIILQNNKNISDEITDTNLDTIDELNNEQTFFCEEDENLQQMKEKLNSIIANNSNNTNKKIDWDKLSNINKNIIAWIEIPGTNINYPILYSDGLYYINHDFENNINRNGSIFVLNQSFQDIDEICIYGHNMKNGTMFANLSNYLNQDFFLNHKKIYIYTKQKTYEGEIFSAYSKGVKEEENSIKSLDLNQKIEYYKNQSTYRQNTEINNKKIVKLITCSYLNAKVSPTDQRYYILAFIKEV